MLTNGWGGHTGLAADQASAPARFRRGFVGLLPLWVGAIPVGIAYSVAARSAGLTPFEMQLMSLTVFSAAAQVSAATLIGSGAPLPVLLATVLALNAQLCLLGLAVARQERPSWPVRLVTAWFLTDGAYGVAVASGRLTLAGLLGAGVSMYLAWNLGTALGAWAGAALPDPRRLGVDFVAPVTFLAVLVPLVRTRAAALTVVASAATVLLLGRFIPGGLTVLAGGLVGSAAGAWLAGLRPGAGGPDAAAECAAPEAAEVTG